MFFFKGREWQMLDLDRQNCKILENYRGCPKFDRARVRSDTQHLKKNKALEISN